MVERTQHMKERKPEEEDAKDVAHGKQEQGFAHSNSLADVRFARVYLSLLQFLSSYSK